MYYIQVLKQENKINSRNSKIKLRKFNYRNIIYIYYINMNSTINLIKEIEDLKKKIKLYEISTKLDYEKIQWLKDEIIYLKYINDMR